MGMELTKIIEYFCVVRKEHIKLLDKIFESLLRYYSLLLKF